MCKSATILIVEDDQSMLDGINDLLQVVDLGYEVDVFMAENGLAGLQVLQEHTPDLIISDIMMPEMEGYEFLEKVRENTKWIFIPFIFLTARGSRQDVHKGRVSGADLYITKPFNSMEFLELVRGQLDRAEQLKIRRQQIAENLKKDLLQILNHEFRTPLTYVTAYYEMLADELSQSSPSRDFYEYLRGIQVGCVRLTRLVEDFIKILEIRTGDIKKRFQNNLQQIHDLNGIVQNAIQLNGETALEYEVEIIFTPGQDLPVINGEPQGLEEIFFQLLNNGIKFTHRRMRGGGTVAISSSAQDGSVTISFTDEGVGIPPSEHEKLFQLFYQYNRGIMEQQGSGLGLTIAKAWVDLHQGQIDIISEEGEGSTFSVTLPTNLLPRDTQSEVVSENSAVATVLVVEDDPHLLAGLKELLEICPGKYRLNVRTAVNGRAGLEMLSRYKPDLIISDIMMPEMDGYEFLNHARENPDWLEIPFIFLTAKGDRRDILRGRSSGVEEYITKPYDSDELIELIMTQLDRHFQVQDIVSQDFDRLKRSVLELVTPDFRQPLSTVTEYSDKLADELKGAETEAELKDSLQEIQNGSRRLVQLVEDVISLAELKTGEAQVAFDVRAQRVANLGVFLYDAAQVYLLRAEEMGIAFKFKWASELPYVYSDTSSLLSILQRLIEKTISYCSDVGNCEVILQSAYENQEVHLSITMPVHLPAAEKEAFLGDRGNDKESEVLPRYPSINIIRGLMNLHNGRIEIRETAVATTIALAFPEQDPPSYD